VTYLLKRNGNYYYNRAVPAIYRDLDPRPNVRVSLNTTSKREALRKAITIDDQVELYWHSLVSDSQKHDERRFGKVVHVCRQMGFSYKPMSAVLALPLSDFVERTLAVQDAKPAQIEAVLGAKEVPDLSVLDALEKYWDLARHKCIDKSANQIRKWKNPRKKAVSNFVNLNGNKEVKDISKDDTLALRDWWLGRIEDENKNPGSANKDFIHLKTVLKTVSKHFKIGLDINHLFEEIMLPEQSEQTRLPFTSEQIVEILESEKLEDMDQDARWFAFATAETGARNTEIIGLLPEDIVLSAEVPHINITGRKGHRLKTVHSKRTIPLVGYSLDAFRARPNGFPKYRGNPDQLTNKANKFLRDNGFFPSLNHSVYSLRHSFQDRLISVDAPNRLQTSLMGHKFEGEKYGNGPTLEKKKEWLDKICLKQTILPS
jgi:integrase